MGMLYILLLPFVLFFQIIMILTISEQDPEQINMVAIVTLALDAMAVIYLCLL